WGSNCPGDSSIKSRDYSKWWHGVAVTERADLLDVGISAVIHPLSLLPAVESSSPKGRAKGACRSYARFLPPYTRKPCYVMSLPPSFLQQKVRNESSPSKKVSFPFSINSLFSINYSYIHLFLA
ncbi:MAG: hypothetical protein J6I89_03535, partial [Oscillospiraceae bacterium]|nr:hypothetical protein [Oscillospiraceae bacterium]